ncbi:MAG: tRNA(His) guanylyltransferase Thg1 family protein [Sandaracinaceae bacterium]
MRFDELDRRMRVFETAHDLCVLPGVFMVARIDGRSFTRLTKEEMRFEAPYDVRFRDCMIASMRRVMECGVSAVYGYTQSDEISILLHRDERAFGRKLRKLNSVLAGEASAAFTYALGTPAAFDCRISQLPTEKDVVDYFRWRQEDAHRNALSGHCYWLLRRRGLDESQATRQLEGTSVSDRNELLFQSGVRFGELPLWQRRGVGVSWETYEKDGFNPKTQQPAPTLRRRLEVHLELPMKAEYESLVRAMVARARPDESEGHEE